MGMPDIKEFFMHLGEDLWIEQVGQGWDAPQHRFEIDIQHLARGPGRAQSMRGQGLYVLQLGVKKNTYGSSLCHSWCSHARLDSIHDN